MTNIQKILNKSPQIASLDVAVFTKYHKGLITLQECKQLFFINNRVDKVFQDMVSDEEFEEWLMTIGYYGGGK